MITVISVKNKPIRKAREKDFNLIALALPMISCSRMYPPI